MRSAALTSQLRKLSLREVTPNITDLGSGDSKPSPGDIKDVGFKPHLKLSQ